MTKLQEVKERVARGVTFMNREYGRSWLRKIDPEQLALDSGNACVLGQVEGDYEKAKATLGLFTSDAISLGFSARRDVEFRMLTRTWKKSVKQLQKLFRIRAPSRSIEM